MHLGIFLGHFPSLPSWPHHERVHGALYMLVMQRFRRHLDRYSSNLLRSLNRPLLPISNYYLSSVSSFRIVSNNFSFRARASSSYLRPVDHVSRRVPLDASSSSIPLRATFDHVAGQSQQFAHATTTPPPSTILLNLGNEQTIREEFPILVQLSSPLLLVEILLEKFTHPFPSKLTRSILLIFRLSSSSPVNLTHSHPSSFNVNSPRPWNPSPTESPSSCPLPFSDSGRILSSSRWRCNTLTDGNEARTKGTGAIPAVRSCVIDTVTRTGKDPSGPSLTSSLGRGREESGVPRETRGDRDRPTRDVSPLPPRPTANGHPRLAPPSTWRTVDTAAFNRWRCAVSPSLFHHGRLPLSFSPSPSRALTDCRASVAQIIVTVASFARWSTRVRPTSTLCSRDNRGRNRFSPWTDGKWNRSATGRTCPGIPQEMEFDI